LAKETGKYLVQHVYERVREARSLDRVLVATDDERIISAVRSFGGEVVMTRPDHVSALAGEKGDCRIATAAAPFDDNGPRSGPSSPLDPNRVKVVVDERGRAMYFSRSLIPYPRETNGAVDRPSRWLLHLGVYGFRADMLRLITGGGSRRVHELERTESLEQLRWLAAGHSIAVVKVQHRFIGIDTPEDYAAFVRRVKSNPVTGPAAPMSTR
jgi:3-deoxy-manno-octulosonate cytidylyltransferase (CMP-KDO synthetase)